MSIIDLRAWVLKDLKRIKTAIYGGNKSRSLPKRALHMERILTVFKNKEYNIVIYDIQLSTGLAKVSYNIVDANKPYTWFDLPKD